MKKILAVAFCYAAFAACNNPANKNMGTQDTQFDGYKERFIESLWKLNPGWASSVGYHKYDSVLVVPDEANRSVELAFDKANLDSLKGFDINALSDNNKTDYKMIENQLRSSEWAINEEKAYEWNPASYNVAEGFANMLSNDYDSLDTRLHNFYLRMASVPAYYEAAKKNIKNPTTEHTQLAIDQNGGGTSVFEKDLQDALAKSHIDAKEKEAITARAKEAANAMKGYADWLKQLKNDNPRSFRLGKELYAKKFDFEIQSGYSAEQIFDKAVQHKKELHEKMFALTKQLWPKYCGNKAMPADTLVAIKQMIDTLSINHVQPDSFQAAIEKQIPELVAFIKAKNLIYLDPSKPLVVRKEPAYMAGVAGASINAPGPYDKNGNTYYNVGSLAGWPKEKAESYLREYNHYIMQILNIHEAIPGHYTQLIYSNQSPSIIKSILGNNAMIEGWAVYAERMMLESGYGGGNTGQAPPEMWLMYYKWNLRSTCNTILDYRVHVKNMSKEEAIHMLVNEAFQQQAEAEGKWKRVSLTQVQLCCYFTGYTEIYDLREELKKKLGDKFNLKQFHEKFLSYGSTPVKYIRELMEKE
ncbi:MAG: DUF885 domain-containing protein [Bacteroidetes bacterium]|nr:DUF885 domain-containing protein [Bacteroidota bacterium]